MTSLHDQLMDAFSNGDHHLLNEVVQPGDLRDLLKKCIEETPSFHKNSLLMLETLFEHNTVDKNFKSELFASIVIKHYDVARLILKHSPSTVLEHLLPNFHMIPDDIYREYAVRAVRHGCESVPELLCACKTSDTQLAVLCELPKNYEVNKHFLDALMYQQHAQAVDFAVDRFIGSNPDLATNVITFILSGEVQNLDHLIVPLLHKYPPTLEHQQWISRSIRPEILPFPVLDELLKYYIVEDSARLLTEASATQNPVVFSKVVGLFTEEQVRATVENPINKAIKLFSPKTFETDRKLLLEYVQHLDNVKQQELLLDNIHSNETTNPARKM